MRKNQTLLTLLTLICSICSLILSMLAFVRSEDTATMVDLQAQNIQLQSQIDKLTTRLTGSTEAPTYSVEDAYCNLIIGDYTATDVQLVIDTVYAQVQLPQSTGTPLTIRRAELVLSLGDNELYQQEITLQPGESEGGYELTLTKLQLPLPDLKEDELLDLKLEVTLSDGQSLRSDSASWYAEGSSLYLIAG